MAANLDLMSARVATQAEGDLLVAVAEGTWQITEPRPAWLDVLGDRKPARVRLSIDPAAKWDTSLLLFLFDAQQWCRIEGAPCDTDALPVKVRARLDQLATTHDTSVPFDRAEGLRLSVGLATLDAWRKTGDLLNFVGECALSLVKLVKRPGKFRWHDFIDEMQQCGVMALPIVSLISFLVGVTLAYTAAIVLRQYGGDIYVADLIGLSTAREMGAVMTSIVLAGRTGAAFAATLGNMKANEEVDALETLGIPAVQFLVLPRVLALAVMMPFLVLYADALGIFGGLVVSWGLLAIPPTAYWAELLTVMTPMHVMVGLIKAVAFGLIIGLSGCLRGLQADRSAAGVGRAATSAVVTAILHIIVADAVFAIAFNVLDW